MTSFYNGYTAEQYWKILRQFTSIKAFKGVLYSSSKSKSREFMGMGVMQ